MNIAAYNILKGGSRGVHWRKLIDEFDVDLLLVQESHPPDRHLPPDSDGRSIWAPASRNKWGSAVWSKRGELREVAIPGYAGWVTGAEIREGSNAFLAFSLHAPAVSGSYAKAVDLVLDEIAKLAKGREILIGGDFNLGVSRCPDASRTLTKRESAIQTRMAEEFGLINCWQEANPGQIPPQTLRWTSNRATPYHCDGIFAPKSWLDRLDSCRVLAGEEWNRLSDHNPVLARFA